MTSHRTNVEIMNLAQRAEKAARDEVAVYSDKTGADYEREATCSLCWLLAILGAIALIVFCAILAARPDLPLSHRITVPMEEIQYGNAQTSELPRSSSAASAALTVGPSGSAVSFSRGMA